MKCKFVWMYSRMSSVRASQAKQKIAESVSDNFVRQWFDHHRTSPAIHKTPKLTNANGKMALPCSCGETIGESTVTDPEIRGEIHKRFESKVLQYIQYP